MNVLVKNILVFLSVLLIICIFVCNCGIIECFFTQNNTPYRLGDMVQSPFMRLYAGEFYHQKKYPNSIASQYMRRTQKSKDYNVLNDIINEEIMKNGKKSVPIKLPNEEIVIHVRIGDVMEFGFSQYIKPLSYYMEHVEILKKYSNSKNVTIVAGSHKNIELRNSMKYLKKLRNMLERSGYMVKLMLNNPADEDFLYMTNAKYFVSSGGSFSNVIKNIVKLRGGMVADDDQSVDDITKS